MKNNEIIKIIESTVISIASSFPGLASIATGWNEYKNHIQTQNIKNIIEIFYNKLSEIDHKINHQYLESDNLKSLMIRTCFYGKEEISKEKRKMLSYFLANSCTSEHYKDVTKNVILETIIKLSEIDVFILNIIADSSKDYQNPILSGSKKYVPNNTVWLSMGELQIIEKVNSHNEQDILMILEYLNAIGVIENLSERGFNLNTDSNISSYLKSKEFEDIQQKKKALRNSDDNMKNFRELEELNEEEQRFIKETEYNESYNYQKYYMITSLGLSVLSYLKE